ncbi:MAG: helix-turn-helix domain-containing protein [Fluviicola sp.]
MSDSREILSKERFNQKIGERIKEIRMEKGISQSDLARLCDKDRQHIELIENSKVNPNSYTIYLIANALEISISEFYNWNK